MRLLTLAVLLLTPAVVSAQGTGTLAGRVVDETGAGLPGANVLLEGTSLGAATDRDGYYRVIGVPVGTYRVTASSTGYGAVTHDDVTVADGYTREVGFSLEMDLSGITICVVHYCPPLFERDAISPRRVSPGDCGMSFENMPIAR